MMTSSDPAADARLRRVPDADGLDPARAPTALVWRERVTSAVSDGQHRITIPCLLGAPAAEGVHAVLTDHLRSRWVIGRIRGRRWEITGVVAAFERAGRQTRLTLAITALTHAGEPMQELDDLRMAHDVSGALARLNPPPPASPSPSE